VKKPIDLSMRDEVVRRPNFCLLFMTSTFSCANERLPSRLTVREEGRWLGWSRLTDLAHPQNFKSGEKRQCKSFNNFALAFTPVVAVVAKASQNDSLGALE
jgi:hypothetical protein